MYGNFSYSTPSHKSVKKEDLSACFDKTGRDNNWEKGTLSNNNRINICPRSFWPHLSSD